MSKKRERKLDKLVNTYSQALLPYFSLIEGTKEYADLEIARINLAVFVAEHAKEIVFLMKGIKRD